MTRSKVKVVSFPKTTMAFEDTSPKNQDINLVFLVDKKAIQLKNLDHAHPHLKVQH